MIYSGVPATKRASGGVAILVDNKWKNKIVNYTYVNERIVVLRIRIERGHLCIFGVYAPEEGRKEETELFYEELQRRLDSCNKNDYVIIAGDLNARVGNQPIDNVVGTFGETHLNENGKELRDFASFNNLKLTNTFFRKKDINKYTWSARGTRSLIDYIITNRKLSPQVMDTHVYRGYDIYSDHCLVISKIKLMSRWVKRKSKKPDNEVFKVSLLQENSIRRLYQERLNQLLENSIPGDDVNEEWKNIKNIIQKAALEALGKRKQHRKTRGMRVWNEDIAKAVKGKQAAYLNFLQKKTGEAEELYKAKRNLAKDIIRKAHQDSWDKFISDIEHDVHGRQTMAYKFIKNLNNDERDRANIDTIETKEWINHYRNLWFNPNVPLTTEMGTIERDVDYIDIVELKNILKTSKNRKATGPDNINSELLKYGSDLLHERLLHLFNMCWRECMIPTEWQTARVISIFKKGDRNSCGNYRGISLLNTAYKLYSKLINNRVRALSESMLLEEQSGFRQGRSCIDDVFTLKQMIEKRREFNLETHIIFIDFEKAFDRVNREKLWSIMERRGFPRHLIQACQSLYQHTKILIGTHKTNEVDTNQGVRQGCSLSPTLFNLYIDDIIRTWKTSAAPGIKLNVDTYINTLLFADDQVIIQECEDDLQRSTYRLHKICQDYGMKISIKKTKSMAFKGKEPIRTKIVIENEVIEQVSHFTYLGCDLTYEYENEIQQKLHKFQYICGTLRKTLRKKTRKETQLKFYRVMATPVLLYGSETWTLGSRDLSRIQATEMRHLRSIKGCTITDKIRNEDIRKELKIFNLCDRIQEYRTKWNEHVQRMPETRFPRAALDYTPKGRRDRGRPRKRWTDQ